MIKAAQLDGFLLLWYDQCGVFTIKQSQHYFLHWTDVGWQHLEMLHVIMMVRHALTRKLMNSKLKIANQKGRWSVIFPSYSSESFTFHEHIRRLPLPWLASGLDSWTTTSRGSGVYSLRVCSIKAWTRIPNTKKPHWSIDALSFCVTERWISEISLKHCLHRFT